jgi:hypothetical protein
MIPTIGFMIAAYIITRMLELILSEDKGIRSSILRITAILCMILTGFFAYALYEQGDRVQQSAESISPY